jgi:glutamate 5-kinase
MAQGAGCATLIALGRPNGGAAGPLAALQAGARATLVEPDLTPAAAYKSWIAGSLSLQGELIIDDGAVTALRAGKSLLPAGVRAVAGVFGKGDAVRIIDLTGSEVARGLCAHGADAARAIAGLRSDAVEGVLGYAGPTALVHRDDMVLTGLHVLEDAHD